MTVPFLDIGAIHTQLRSEISCALADVVDSGNFVRGAQVEAFEAEFASFVDADHCVGTGNGLDALELALRAHGVQAGDEVIVAAHTFIATWLAVTRIGAVPIPVDAGTGSFLIDCENVKLKVSAKTRAIVPVHLYGEPVLLTALRAVADHHGLALVEDAAQAHGASIDGRPVGSIGTCAWSFYPGKNLGALGDGGAVTTNDSQVADRVRLLGNYGSRRKYVHEVAGFNSRLDEIQAAVLRVKLRALRGHNARREAIAQTYTRGLGHLLDVPAHGSGAKSSWHLYVVRHPQRDRLQMSLAAKGVETLIHYPTPVHLQPPYRTVFGKTHLPWAERYAGEVLSLPIGPAMTDAQVTAVIGSITSALASDPTLSRRGDR